MNMLKEHVNAEQMNGSARHYEYGLTAKAAAGWTCLHYTRANG